MFARSALRVYTPLMGAERRRYTRKQFPNQGPAAVTLSFRVSEAVAELLDARIATKPNGITNRSDALQDATVIWLMLEDENGAE